MRLYEKYLEDVNNQLKSKCPDEALVFELTGRLNVLMTIQAIRNKMKLIRTHEDYETFIQTLHRLGYAIQYQSADDQSRNAVEMRTIIWKNINKFKRYPFDSADFVADVNFATEKIATEYLRYRQKVYNKSFLGGKKYE